MTLFVGFHFMQTLFSFAIMSQIPTTIKNIIFDLGGVILDIDPERSVRAFESLGLKGAILTGGWGYKHEVFLNMEKGLISDEEFRDGVRSLLNKPVADEVIDQAWCAMLVDFPADRVELLKRLKSDFRLYLFSNTNHIHWKAFHSLFQKQHKFSLSSLFERDYYSHELKNRKPALESFQAVIDQAGLNPSETLFIDDSKENIEGAQQVGLHAIHLSPEKDLQGLFS